MGKKLKIGGACLNQIPMDWDNNIRNIVGAVREAKRQQIKILCLPELCITGYGCEDMFLSRWLSEKAMDKLHLIIPETRDIAIAAGLPVHLNGYFYNVTCFIYDQKILGFYAKQLLANDGVHYEPRWFTPWKPGEVSQLEFDGQLYPFGHISANLFGLKIGFEICEDAWRANRPACHVINKDVELILNPSASHFAFGKAEFRENLVVKSSGQFNCVYLYTNLLGNEAGRMIYDGDILIAQRGELKTRNTRLSFRDFNVLGSEIDFEEPHKSETRILADSHDPIEEFGKACSLALFDYLRKSKSKGFVLSLSGGADSSSIAVLVAEAVRNGLEELKFETFKSKLGTDLEEGPPEHLVGQLLHTAYQGTVNSSEDTFNSARTLAESIGAKFYHWQIDEQIASYRATMEKVLNRSLQWSSDDIALQNIQARARSPIIWMLANIKNCLLLSTSNRSEGDVGYTTMDGDTSGSISPIAAVSKSFVLKWLRYAEKTLGYKGLSRVNRLIPTAELRPLEMQQTDEEDLMSYAAMVEIEKRAIRDKRSPREIYEELKPEFEDPGKLKGWIVKFFRLWAINQWKRERIAPSFHLDDFNVDPRTWCRFPILSSGFKEELMELEKDQGTGSYPLPPQG